MGKQSSNDLECLRSGKKKKKKRLCLAELHRNTSIKVSHQLIYASTALKTGLLLKTSSKFYLPFSDCGIFRENDLEQVCISEKSKKGRIPDPHVFQNIDSESTETRNWPADSIFRSQQWQPPIFFSLDRFSLRDHRQPPFTLILLACAQ